MTAHIVCWKVSPFADGHSKNDNILEIKKRLEELPSKISQIKALQVGINENGGEYDVVLVSLFDSPEALDAYDKNPYHVKVKDFIGLVTDKHSTVDYSF